MFRFYIALFFWFLSLPMPAQESLSGRVVDCQNQKGIANVFIEIQGWQHNTFSDQNGNFRFENLPAGTYHLYLVKDGYKALFSSVKIKKGTNTPILLSVCKEEAVKIEEITVTATRSDKKFSDVPVPVQVISKNEIAKSQAVDFESFLENDVSGIHFTYEGGSPNINMLGFGGKYVLFLVDSKPMAGETFDNVDYQRVNLDNVERIEIIKGASSSLYGSNAIGGVINIITRKAQAPLEVRADYVYDTNIDQKANLSVATKQKWGSLHWASFYKMREPYTLEDSQPRKLFYTDGSVKELPPEKFYIAGFSNYGVSPKLSFTPSPKWDIEVAPSYYFSRRNDGSPDAEKVLDHYYNYAFSIQSKYQFTENQSVKASAMYDRYDKFKYFRLLDEEEKNYQNTLRRADVQYNRLFFNKHSFVAGGEILADELRTSRFTTDTSQETKSSQNYAFFAQQDWVLTSKLTLVTGVRADYHSVFKNHFTYRLSAIFKVADFSFRGGYAGGFRAPTIKELYTNWYHPWGGGFQISGNTALKPETSDNFNLSVDYQYKKLTFNATTQYSVVHNKIDVRWSDAKDQLDYVNFLGKTRVVSSDFSLSYRLYETMRLQGTYTFYDIENRASESRPHVFTFKVDYTPLAHQKYVPGVTLSGKYAVATTIHSNEESNTVEDYYTHYEAYWLWRLQTSVKLPYHLTFSAGVNNLFNYKASPVGFYAPITPGRSFYAGLKFDF
ncbi:TonB-dependent receptor [Capnocytophaga sp.]|uniref:TonB-dependent receptor n=1 Tax=Capnocytophaga sp. TaxID=44737 RepID=UPI0026DCE01F|nr:TonB-dependent receptor [Capnocytophaga sp.]MDO5104351.1 TonB-dependent receptor [Capnocytophaga sp.]